jgi:hypothetical protein
MNSDNTNEASPVPDAARSAGGDSVNAPVRLIILEQHPREPLKIICDPSDKYVAYEILDKCSALHGKLLWIRGGSKIIEDLIGRFEQFKIELMGFQTKIETTTRGGVRIYFEPNAKDHRCSPEASDTTQKGK